VRFTKSFHNADNSAGIKIIARKQKRPESANSGMSIQLPSIKAARRMEPGLRRSCYPKSSSARDPKADLQCGGHPVREPEAMT